MSGIDYAEVAENIDRLSESEVRRIIEKYDLEEMNPFSGWKDNQLEALVETIYLLVVEGKTNVLLDLPTGVGKSLINVLAVYAIKMHRLEQNKEWRGGFYTTPQKKLRNQLEEDEDLMHLYQALQSRADYTCGVTGDNCKDCEISRSDDESCFDYDRCTYVQHKRAGMDHDLAVLTFAYLIVDNYLPKMSHREGEEEQISFGKRDGVISDEVHNLENQTASLHAGFKVSPSQVPLEVFENAFRHIPDDPSFGDIREALNELHQRLDEFVDRNAHIEDTNVQRQVEECQKLSGRIRYCLQEIQNGRDWVVETYEVSVSSDISMTALKLEPVKVDKFLQDFVWSRGGKRILSTATTPFRDDWPSWCERIGLDPKETGVVSYGMPFPKDNRPIVTGTIIDNFSSGGDDENWEEIMETINRLAGENRGRGLIHAASYNRAQKFFNWSKRSDYPNLKGNVKLHSRKESGDVVENWQASDKDICVSPSMMEGVDLYDDRCRWQVLLKVPYPNPYNDKRTKFIMDNEKDGWKWYRETTATRVVQSVGRAVRSKDDYATYYVLDGAFNDLMDQVTTPDWFDEALVESVETQELFGYDEEVGSPEDIFG